MPREAKPVVEYKVWYKANPEYDGDHHVPQCEGLQGTFEFLADAEKAVQTCRRWWNEKKVLNEWQDDKGFHSDVKTTIHDNVIIWIETHKDHVHIEAEDRECEFEGKKGKKKKELAPA